MMLVIDDLDRSGLIAELREKCDALLEWQHSDMIRDLRAFLERFDLERTRLERASRLQDRFSADEAALLFIPTLDSEPSIFELARKQLSYVEDKAYIFRDELGNVERLRELAVELQAYFHAIARAIEAGDLESDEQCLVTGEALATWLMARGERELPPTLRRFLPDKDDDDWYMVYARHETELLRIQAAAVKQFWLDHDPDMPPLSNDVVDWLKSTFNISDNMARAIDSLIRTGGRKRTGLRKR